MKKKPTRLGLPPEKRSFKVIRLTQPDAFFEQSYCCPAGRDSSSHLDALPCQIREGFSLKQSIQDIMETNFSHLKASKVCACCKIEKPLSEFGKNARLKDGHNIYCKVCQNEKIRESRERRKNTLPPPSSLACPWRSKPQSTGQDPTLGIHTERTDNGTEEPRLQGPSCMAASYAPTNSHQHRRIQLS